MLSLEPNLLSLEGCKVYRPEKYGEIHLDCIKPLFQWLAVLLSYTEHSAQVFKTTLKVACIRREMFRGQILLHLYFYNLQCDAM